MTARPVIGGQAVIEGVMMRSPKSFAVAVRKPDGSIAIREDAWLSFSDRFRVLKLPFLRGANMLVESMVNGIMALNFSAAAAYPEDDKAQRANKKGRDGVGPVMLVSLVFAFLLFKGVPHLSALGLGLLFGGGDGATALPTTGYAFHAVDGLIKLAIFVGYIAIISRLDDVKRLFMYHGAEHKSVHTYEAEEPLDVEHTRPKSTAHPRCGTGLILLSIVASFVVFVAILPHVPVVFENTLLQSLFLLVLKIPLLPVIGGVAYEAQRLAARYPTNVVVRVLIAPGMLMQRLTTREPGDKELEVALAALRKTVWREKGADVVPLKRETTVEVFQDFDAVAKAVA
jgi:uncharacterized protein YqhQ